MTLRNKKKQHKIEQLFQQAFGAHQAGKLEEAKSLYLRVLKVLPADMETLYLLGTAFSQTGDFEAARTYLLKAIKLNPKHVEALNNLGLTMKGLNQPREAIGYYERALALRPDYVDALSNTGNALEFLREFDRAEPYLRKAVALDAQHADAHCNLGLVLNGKDQFEEAAQCIRRGLELRPDHAISYDFLGSIYKIWGRFDEALACLDKAVALSPDTYSPRNNRGALLEEVGRFDEALADYRRAAEIAPNDTTARWNQAFLFLRQGILDRGWEAHELRLLSAGQVSVRFPYPQWDGSSLAGKTLLIYAEQGLGDEIMFASCLPDVVALAGHCVIECAPRLGSLFRRSFPTATVVAASRMEVGWLLDVPAIDVQIAAGSLPRLLRPTIDSFPARPAYLSADVERAAFWRKRVETIGPGLKVGICWRSGLRLGERHKYYSDLTQWGPLFALAGVHFFNLQYGQCEDELRAASDQFGVTITNYGDIDLREDIDDSAALMASMDLVISAATAVSEIAGALGIASYRLNSYGKQWEVLGRTDFNPWHPNTTLFDQTAAGDWDTQLAMVADALRDRVAGHASAVDYVTLASGIAVAVSALPEDPIRYILTEQGKWFDAEGDFLLGLAGPGMRIVDIGAGVGVHALPLAKKVAPGTVLAITDGVAETALLMKSRSRNHLERSLHVLIGDINFSIDTLIDPHGLDDIALVRLAIGSCHGALLAGAARFFAINSPLVMVGIRPGNDFDATVPNWLIGQGYGLYRLVPGLNVLVPCASTDELDAYSLSLFACKPDRAALLASQGALAMAPVPPVLDPMQAARSDWQDYLARYPYARSRMHGWLATPQPDADRQNHQLALNLFVVAMSGQHAATVRYTCLQGAGNVLGALVQGQANLPRLLSLCRVLHELGKRELAVNVLGQLCDLLRGGMSTVLDEPCLALSEQFAAMSPQADATAWVMAMVLSQRDQWRAFSTYFTGQDSLNVFDEVVATGFAPDDVRRKIALINERFGHRPT